MDAAFFMALVINYGYIGVFLSSIIGSASIFLPLPGFAFVFAAGSILNPLAVGIVAGVGSSIGELVGYAAGHGIGRVRKKKGALFRWADKWFVKGYGFWLILIFAATPLPDDIIGLLCGYSRYDVKKFFIATTIGKVLLSIALAYGGLYGVEILRSVFL